MHSLSILSVAVLILLSCKEDPQAAADAGKLDAAQAQGDASVTTVDGAVPPPKCSLQPASEPIEVVGPQDTPLHPFGVVSDPMVVKEGGNYRMWFTSNDWLSSDPIFDGGDSTLGIAYAISSDGLVFDDSQYSPQPDHQIQLQVEPGIWDGKGVETASVVQKPDGNYLLFYTGDKEPDALSYSIGIATSTDGLAWTKPNEPSFVPEHEWEQPLCTDPPACTQYYGGVLEPTALYDAQTATYHLWYAALGLYEGTLQYRMGHATSSDAIAWTRGPLPVFSSAASGAWDDEVVSHFDVVQDKDSSFHLFYFGSAASQSCENCGLTAGSIGHATSEDGISWTRSPSNPLSLGSSDAAYMVGGPSAMLDDGQMRLWYFQADSLDDANVFSLSLKATTMACEE